jgi:hypothetical protein
MSKSVVILGTGLSLSKFKTEEHSGSELWATGSAFDMLKNLNIVSKYFCLHTGETIEFDGEIINQNNYPLKEIIDKYQSRFFTNSISYMIAFAIYSGFKKITMYGVDLEVEGEYSFERPSVTYWIGFARGLSIEVNIASDIDDPLFLYGFENPLPLLKRLKERVEMSKILAHKNQDLGNEVTANQYIGQYVDAMHWIKEMVG